MLFSEKLRKYALASKESPTRIARESRVGYKELDQFLKDEASIRIETTDKLAEYLKLEIFKKSSTKQKKGNTISEQLRMHLADCKDTLYKISKDSGVERGAIRLFLKNERGLELKTVDKLARYLELDLRKKD